MPAGSDYACLDCVSIGGCAAAVAGLAGEAQRALGTCEAAAVTGAVAAGKVCSCLPLAGWRSNTTRMCW